MTLNGEKSREVAEVLKLTSNMCSDIFCGDWLLFGSEVESEVGVLMNLTTMTMYDGRILSASVCEIELRELPPAAALVSAYNIYLDTLLWHQTTNSTNNNFIFTKRKHNFRKHLESSIVIPPNPVANSVCGSSTSEIRISFARGGGGGEVVAAAWISEERQQR